MDIDFIKEQMSTIIEQVPEQDMEALVVIRDIIDARIAELSDNPELDAKEIPEA